MLSAVLTLIALSALTYTAGVARACSHFREAPEQVMLPSRDIMIGPRSRGG
jgi:hypothetical protein